MDQEPGAFGYKDMSIAVENAMNNATRITAALVAQGQVADDVDIDDIIMRSASRFLDWYGDRMRDDLWGTPPIEREPVDDGPHAELPPEQEEAPPPEDEH